MVLMIGFRADAFPSAPVSSTGLGARSSAALLVRVTDTLVNDGAVKRASGWAAIGGVDLCVDAPR
jgi:hypothetical protein